MADKDHLPSETEGEARGPGVWIGALVLIAVGILFLLQNSGIAIPGNWWALFLLIPAIAAFVEAWRSYARDGQFSSSVIGSLITGVVLIVLTAMFMFDADLDWGLIWPVVLILIGIVALGRAYRRS